MPDELHAEERPGLVPVEYHVRLDQRNVKPRRRQRDESRRHMPPTLRVSQRDRHIIHLQQHVRRRSVHVGQQHREVLPHLRSHREQHGLHAQPNLQVPRLNMPRHMRHSKRKPLPARHILPARRWRLLPTVLELHEPDQLLLQFTLRLASQHVCSKLQLAVQELVLLPERQPMHLEQGRCELRSAVQHTV